MSSAQADALDALGDFTATRRILVMTAMAVGIGLVGALLARGLLALIALATNLFFFVRFSTAPVSPADAHLGPIVMVIPALGGLIIGLLARLAPIASAGMASRRPSKPFS